MRSKSPKYIIELQNNMSGMKYIIVILSFVYMSIIISIIALFFLMRFYIDILLQPRLAES